MYFMQLLLTSNRKTTKRRDSEADLKTLDRSRLSIISRISNTSLVCTGSVTIRVFCRLQFSSGKPTVTPCTGRTQVNTFSYGNRVYDTSPGQNSLNLLMSGAIIRSFTINGLDKCHCHIVRYCVTLSSDCNLLHQTPQQHISAVAQYMHFRRSLASCKALTDVTNVASGLCRCSCKNHGLVSDEPHGHFRRPCKQPWPVHRRDALQRSARSVFAAAA